MVLKNWQTHQQDAKKIRDQLLASHAGSCSGSQCTSHLSNTMRSKEYRKHGPKLDLDSLNKVISVDTEKMVAIVEPRVTMDQLVRETSKFSVVPAVIPEFKGISVGGAVMGAALESSSHVHGQFNDICVAYEILLGNGDIIRATPTENSDLFYGISGSYGTLGVLLSIEIALVPAKPWVKVRYHHCHDVEKSLELMNKLHLQKNPPHFLEGIVFSKDHQVVIEGEMVDDEEAKTIQNQVSLASPWSRWFYTHAQATQSKDNTDVEKIRLDEYLFRHDRGAFWIGTYGKHWGLLGRYWLERLKLGSWSRQLFSKIWGPLKSKKLSIDTPASSAFRYCFGWILTSRRLYSWLHANAEQWVGKHFVVQDFHISRADSPAFVNKILQDIAITPIWLCPLKPTKQPQLLSPHHVQDENTPLLINIGVYGIPQRNIDGRQATELLENWTRQYRRRKMLYSLSYYTEDEFWEIYPKQWYEDLRQKYQAEPWVNIEKKVLTT